MTVLSAIGEIQRFPSAKKLVGYSGLGARVHASGQTRRTGRISKEGRSELRTALIEAAWEAVRFDATWKQRFVQLEARLGSGKAIVAMARKLLVVIWHVLTTQRADRAAEPVAVARKFLRWGSSHQAVREPGQSRAAFMRQYLDCVGVGANLEELDYRGEHFDLRPIESTGNVVRNEAGTRLTESSVTCTPAPDGLALACSDVQQAGTGDSDQPAVDARRTLSPAPARGSVARGARPRRVSGAGLTTQSGGSMGP